MRYNSDAIELNLKETQIAIKTLKDYFQRDLANTLNLARVSAPLMVRPETGLNDNLSGVEKPVNFKVQSGSIDVEIVQSLAKWKRNALKEYGFNTYEGLYTDMNAIRPDETLDEIHSIYVDQWDWEKIIKFEDRNKDYLRQTVREIYEVFKNTEDYINHIYPNILSRKLPDEITFITTQELEDLYPKYTPKERERKIAMDKKAVFIEEIGYRLNSGNKHDDRSPDYDDWNLNGDILFWNKPLDNALELSSMGIRVDSNSLEKQIRIDNKEERMSLPYHQNVLNNILPYTIGGGIGQSRLCMFFLEKKHIGEVQAAIWDDETIKNSKENGIILL
ncbi:aspartate--ammonia ligase [Peptoniphilus sp.]|uniref:aspartate--ammonia ligase n=1 Tax=Peptoniphilus sp. TaxID=1971214 RepID=UPI003992B846